MPRISRGDLVGHTFHTLNRGNGGALIFHTETDYSTFLEFLVKAKKKFSVQLFGFCLLPDHFHLVIEPESAKVLSRFMQWLLTSHVRSHNKHYNTRGHVWEGRFKSFPIQKDSHFLTILRYVLRNPIRAGLASYASEWQWSSSQWPNLIDPWPVGILVNLNKWADEPLSAHELERIRTCVNRQAPYGSPTWQAQTAAIGGLQSTLRPRGRPRKYLENSHASPNTISSESKPWWLR